jgi:hypothetical protein
MAFLFVIFNPEVYPLNKAFITGYLTREEMEHEHPLELEELEKMEDEMRAEKEKKAAEIKVKDVTSKKEENKAEEIKD